jgi:hypothetical protein
LLDDATNARNVILTEQQVRDVVAASYKTFRARWRRAMHRRFL